MRSILLPALFCTTLILAACSPEDPFVPTYHPTDSVSHPAYLRVIHASAAGPAVDVMVDGTPFFTDQQHYLTFVPGVNEAKYYPVDTAAGTIAFVNGGTLASAELHLRVGGHYTAYFYGPEGDYDALVTTDTVAPRPGTTQMRYRVVHLAPGAPTIDIAVGESTTPPALRNVAYGTATEYATYTTATARPGLYIYQPGSGASIFGIDNLAIVTNAIQTLVMTGSLDPTGNEPLLSFSVFQESSRTGRDSLYGSAPFRVEFGAVRFINLTPSGLQGLDVALLDSSVGDWTDNQYFRRNIGRQADAVLNVAPLDCQTPVDPNSVKPSFLISTFLQDRYPFRIELHSTPPFSTAAQEVLVPTEPGKGIEFRIQAGRRYTIVAYGPFAKGQAQATVISANPPAVSGTSASVRLFHGEFEQFSDQELRASIGGATGPPMAYGQPPASGDSFEVPAGSTDVNILNASGDTVLSTTLPEPLEGGSHYTLFLGRGSNGDAPCLRAIADRLEL